MLCGYIFVYIILLGGVGMEENNKRVKKVIKIVSTSALILFVLASVAKATEAIMNNGYDTAAELSKVAVGTDIERVESIAIIGSDTSVVNANSGETSEEGQSRSISENSSEGNSSAFDLVFESGVGLVRDKTNSKYIGAEGREIETGSSNTSTGSIDVEQKGINNGEANLSSEGSNVSESVNSSITTYSMDMKERTSTVLDKINSKDLESKCCEKVHLEEVNPDSQLKLRNRDVMVTREDIEKYESVIFESCLRMYDVIGDRYYVFVYEAGEGLSNIIIVCDYIDIVSDSHFDEAQRPKLGGLYSLMLMFKYSNHEEIEGYDVYYIKG